MTGVSPVQRDLLALCALRVNGAGLDPNLIARACQAAGGDVEAVRRGEFGEESTAAVKARRILLESWDSWPDAYARVDAELDAAGRARARLVTVTDESYPVNLRPISRDLPPFLFYLGDLQQRDHRSIAVIGTREASRLGMARAAKMARGLTAHDVAVYSGLARGIDTAAHLATLEAGGRTVAVMGTGIAVPFYPPENRPLAQRILAGGGALVSHLWPTTRPDRTTFPQRNAVMSGLVVGSTVIEASSRSGARLQARLAAEQRKQVFLLRSLVADERWAATMISNRRAVEVGELDDVLSRLDAPPPQRTVPQPVQLAGHEHARRPDPMTEPRARSRRYLDGERRPHGPHNR